MKRLQIGETIRTLRKNKGITQEQLAEVLDISTPAISKWESDQTYPDIAMIPIIARYFQVTTDFLFGFSSELSPEDIKEICNDVTQKFNTLQFQDALKEWLEYLRQFPTHYQLKYELATLGVFNLIKANSEEETFDFVNKIIRVFEQCISSDVLKIKQGAYFQIANLYVILEDFDKAQEALDQLPMQLANPKVLQTMIYIRKGDFKQADKSIQENILKAVNEILGELGNKISIHQMPEHYDINVILDLSYKVQQIISTFGLEPIYSVSDSLMMAFHLAHAKEYEKVKIELEKVIAILEKYPQDKVTIQDIPFFKDVEQSLYQDRLQPVEAYHMIIEQIFSLLGEDTAFQEVKSKLKHALS